VNSASPANTIRHTEDFEGITSAAPSAEYAGFDGDMTEQREITPYVVSQFPIAGDVARAPQSHQRIRHRQQTAWC
jgi:hypothetical protein